MKLTSSLQRKWSELHETCCELLAAKNCKMAPVVPSSWRLRAQRSTQGSGQGANVFSFNENEEFTSGHSSTSFLAIFIAA
jgi:hypothetical protein